MSLGDSRPVKLLERIYRASVFAPITRELVGVRLMATLFHRGTATLYLGYTIWAIASAIFGIPSLQQTQGEIWQVGFSLLVFIACAPAAVGATFFPRLARLEMFAAASFVGLILFYVIELAVTGLASGDAGRPISAILIGTVMIFPAIRVVFIYFTLIRNEENRKVLGDIKKALNDDRE
jgi:hypothetical protein